MKIAASLLLVVVLGLLVLAQAGDNPDARSLSHLAYYPAALLGGIDAILWLAVIFK